MKTIKHMKNDLKELTEARDNLIEANKGLKMIKKLENRTGQSTELTEALIDSNNAYILLSNIGIKRIKQKIETELSIQN